MSATPPAGPAIIFGTDGWRARIGEEYTFDNVRRCAQGVAEWVVSQGSAAKGVVVGYDRRFASEHFATAAAEVLLAHDIPVLFAAGAIPTQMTSYEVVERGAACAVMITASHNPWTDNGFKIKSPTGAAADPAILSAVERSSAARAGELPPRRAFDEAEDAGAVERFDPYAGYEAYVRRTLDLDRLRAQPTCACWSIRSMARVPAGSAGCWRAAASSSTRSTASATPGSAGVNPEPIRPHVDEALARVRDGGYDLGLLLDGDADRAGAVDERGQFIHQLQCMGLLMYYLLEHRGERAPVVTTVNETSMALRLGERYGVAVHETPVGFKFVGPRMIETGAMMGGEESGGYGFGMHLPERDGIYADLLLLDLFVREREAGRAPVSAAVAHLHDIAGPSFYLRDDVHTDRASYPALKARLLRRAGRALAGQPGRAAGGAHGQRWTRVTASSSGSTMARGCWSASAAPSRWSGSTRRPAAPSCATPSWPRAAAWSRARRSRRWSILDPARAAASSTTWRSCAVPTRLACSAWSPSSRTSSRRPGASRAR